MTDRYRVIEAKAAGGFTERVIVAHSLTEEEAIEYLIKKDIPKRVWSTWNEGNKPKMVICRTHQLPEHRQWRNAWQITDDIELAA